MSLADFDINADGTDQGYDADASEALVFTLRNAVAGAGIRTWKLQVFAVADFDETETIAANPPRASKQAPTLVLHGATSGQSVSPASITGSITATAPADELVAYILRSTVNGGKDARGRLDPTLVRERMIVRRDAAGLRTIVATETYQYETAGWAGAFDDLVQAISGGVGMPAIADRRLVGNASGVSSRPAAITVTNALDFVFDSTAKAWIFDGVDDEVDVGAHYAHERTDSWSVSAWVKTSGTGVAQSIVGNNQNSAASRGWCFYINTDGTLHFQVINTVNTNDLEVAARNVNVDDGVLHHVVATYGGTSAPSGVHIYIDGVDQTLTTVLNNLSATAVSASNLKIGGRGDVASPTAFFAGQLEHVSLWDEVLTSGNATTLYNGGAPGDLSAVSFVSHLQSWWKLDATDTTAAGGIADYGPSNFDGTALNGLNPDQLRGNMLVRDGSEWIALAPGSYGAPLLSSGVAQKPSFPVLGSIIRPRFRIRTAYLGSTGGSPGDQTIFNASCPVGLRIEDVSIKTSVVGAGGSTAQLFTGTGGGGVAKSSAMSTASLGTSRDNSQASSTLAPGDSLYVHLSDNAAAVEVIVEVSLT